MKFTITKVFYLLCLLLIFGMSSCEKDLYEDQISQSKFKVEEFSLKDTNSKVSLNSNFLKAVSEIKKTIKSTNSKIVYDTINQIYFDDEKGIKITKDDYESYTFRIIKEGGKVENLVFCENVEGEFYAYKILYDFTEEEAENFTQEQITSRPKTIVEIKSGTIENRTAMCGEWEYEVHFSPRDGGIAGPNTIVIAIWVVGVCDAGGGTGTGPGTGQSGDGSGFGGNNSTGYGDGSGNNNNSGNTSTPNGGGNSGGGGGSTPPTAPPIVTTPVLELEDEFEQETPCTSLKNFMKKSTNRSKFNTLNTAQMFNRTYETAYAETKTGNVRGFTLITSQSGSSNHVNFPSSLDIISYMHVHNNDFTKDDINGNQITIKTSKNPSAQDLITFVGTMQTRAYQQSVPMSETYGMTISSLGIFCFKVKASTLNDLQAITNQSGIDWNKFKRDCDRLTKEIYKKNLTDAQKLNLALEMILKMMKDKGLDQVVGLYEGTATTNGSLTNIDWKEKVLDANNALTEIPCIN